MTVKEYLHQAYRLDQRIKSDTMEAQNLREMAGSVSAIQYDKDRVQTSRNTEAPFVRTLEKLWTLEKKIAGELEMLSDLKKQIREVIEAVPDTDERMVLKYRYIHNYTWEQIGMELCACLLYTSEQILHRRSQSDQKAEIQFLRQRSRLPLWHSSPHGKRCLSRWPLESIFLPIR